MRDQEGLTLQIESVAMTTNQRLSKQRAQGFICRTVISNQAYNVVHSFSKDILNNSLY
jgi:hypothetical protein